MFNGSLYIHTFVVITHKSLPSAFLTETCANVYVHKLMYIMQSDKQMPAILKTLANII